MENTLCHSLNSLRLGHASISRRSICYLRRVHTACSGVSPQHIRPSTPDATLVEPEPAVENDAAAAGVQATIAAAVTAASSHDSCTGMAALVERGPSPLVMVNCDPTCEPNSSRSSSPSSSKNSNSSTVVLVADSSTVIQVSSGSTATSSSPLTGMPSATAVDASLSSSLTSFSSIDDEALPKDVAIAQQAARARAAARRAGLAPAPSWWPPLEFSALVGLCLAIIVSGLSNIFLCKPVMLSHCLVRHGRHRVMKQCSSCCAPPAAQARHLVYMQRQPQQVLPPLPLPLRQHLEMHQLPAPTYKVPSLESLPGPAPDQLTSTMVAAQEWLHSRLAYRLQQLATANVSTKVLALWLFATPFIMLAAAMYQKAAAVSFKEAMYKVYALLMRVPGIGIAKENNTASYFVANMVFLAGVFSFAAVIGIVSDEIKVGIKNSRAGNYNMRLHGHIILLNWNSSSTALLRHLASAYADGGMFNNGAPWLWNNRPPVVVLANKPKVEMDEAVHEMLKDRGLKLEVHTREGNPFKMSDLRKVAASEASTIIVLHPESTSSANAEAIKVSVAMSLTALGASSQQRVVVQGPSAGTSTVLDSLEVTTRRAGGPSTIQAFELPDSQLTHRLVAQTAAQPGILTCWLDLLALTNSSAQFYCAPVPTVLQGKPFVELRRAFLHAVLCGYRTPEAVCLNPAETDVPPPDSSLIMLGRGGAPHLMATPGSSNLYETAASAAEERLKKEPTYKSKARSILVTNWPKAGVQQLMDGFSMFTPAGSTVSFILPDEPDEAWPSKLRSCRFNFITAENPTSAKVLLDAGIKTADAVVLGSGPPTGSEMEADARILAAVLQVQDAVMASKRRDAPHLVAPIRRYATSKLAAQFLEVLATEQLPGKGAESPLSWLTVIPPMAAGVPAPTSAAAAAATSAAPSTSGSSAGATTGQPTTSTSSTSADGVSSSTAEGATAASNRSPGILVNALKAVGALPGSGAAAAVGTSQQQQQSKPPVITEPEFLVPPDVASALMTQVVSEPAYSDIMRSLMLCTEGSMELYLRNPASFNLPTGVPLTFAEVQEAVRRTRQIAIGYIRGRGSSACTQAVKNLKGSQQHQRLRKAVLGCSASHRVEFGEADRIVVIAQDYNL